MSSVESSSDEWKLLDRARRGSEACWKKLVEMFYPPLMRMTFLITGSMEATQDVVQESFIKLLYLKPKHQQGQLNAYLSTIVYRSALKERRRLLNHVNLDNIDAVDHSSNPMSLVLKEERERLIFQAIEALDDVHREVLVLRFYGEHSYDEIAQIMDLPLGTVKSRVFYAVRKCREDLQKRGLLE